MTDTFEKSLVLNQFLDTVNYIARLHQLGSHNTALVESIELNKSLSVAVKDGTLTEDQANLVLNFLGITE